MHKISSKHKINKMGGPKALYDMLPAKKDELLNAFLLNENLNTISLDRWDRAAGFIETKTQPPRYLINHTNAFQIKHLETFCMNVPCVSNGICILKDAAYMLCRYWLVLDTVYQIYLMYKLFINNYTIKDLMDDDQPHTLSEIYQNAEKLVNTSKEQFEAHDFMDIYHITKLLATHKQVLKEYQDVCDYMGWNDPDILI